MAEVSGSPSPDRPLVTFFVLAYRQEAKVRAAIESAFAQTWSPLEIILSDDHSPDGTFAVMEEMAAAYDGPHEIRLNRNPTNLGIVPHIDRVMELASGELVVQNAGDDVSRPDRAERLAGMWLASGRRAKLLHSAAEVMDAPPGHEEIRRPRPMMIEAPTPLNILRHRLVALGAASAWDREVFDRFGPLGGDLGVEDTVLPFRAALLGDIAYTDEPLVRWRAGGTSWSPKRAYGPSDLYGISRRLDLWRAQNCRHILARFADLDYPDKAEAEAICRHEEETCQFMVDASRASRPERLAMAPRALALAYRRRSAWPLRELTKYLFEEIYAGYWDARYGGRSREERAG
jgi:glycosyltransferase involved in cell wall biosynthesis